MADTPDAVCAAAATALHSSFSSGKSLTYEWRLGQLLALKKLVNENKTAISEVLSLDLGLFGFASSSCVLHDPSQPD